MPTDVQITIQGLSNLPKDRYVHTLHFDGDDWDGTQTDELWSKWEALKDQVLGGYSQTGHRIACYEPGPNPTGPYFAKDYTVAAASTNSAVTEVALCLSYAAADDPDASTPRRRGRIYLGPFASGIANLSRPGQTVMDAALAYGEGIAQVGIGQNVTWSLYSPTDATYAKIESIWVDNAWDTQRRRGLEPTVRTVRDVQ